MIALSSPSNLKCKIFFAFSELVNLVLPTKPEITLNSLLNNPKNLIKKSGNCLRGAFVYPLSKRT